jgi:hypothetical protein
MAEAMSPGAPVGFVPDPPQTAAPVGFVPDTPTFTGTNAKDASGDATVDPNTVGTFARHVGSQLNPVTILQGMGQVLPIPKALGGGGMDAPLKFLQHAVFPTEILLKAKDSFQQGDYVTAARHFIDYVLPVIGPALEGPADAMQQGKYAAGMGDAIGLGTALFGAEGLSNLLKGAKAGPLVKNPNAAERAAVDFGHTEGVPIDAATATGSPAVAGLQKLVDESIGGGQIGSRARAAQETALDATGNRLAAGAKATASTPEVAGTAISDALTKKITDLHHTATAAYTKLRAMEADPFHGDYVPVDVTPAAKGRMKATLGEIPSAEDLQGLRRIREEMRALPFQESKLVRDGMEGSDLQEHYVPRQAGAKVYRDIGQLSGSNITRAEMEASIDRALETGNFTPVSKAALEVVRKRVSDPYEVSTPLLPEGAGAKTQGMLMPVDIRPAKASLKPLYDELMQKRAITGVLQGAEGRAAVALDSLFKGPDHAPLTIVDAALSDIKSLARGNGDTLPAMRSRGQAVAGQAVKYLEAQVRGRAAQAGPHVLQTLEEGRAATHAKYTTADVLDQIRQEPVQAYRQMTAPKDAGIKLLRTVQREAPQVMPEIARAYLDDLLQKATEAGGFKHADRLFADWQKLGAETKRALFPKEGQTAALDNFFLLAKRIAANPNPSGTALTLWKGGELTALVTNPVVGVPYSLSMAALSKLLHSPTGVRLLTRGLSIPVGNKVAATAWAAEFAKAVGGTGSLVPAAAAADQERSGR